MKQYKKGFTLGEILVALVIMSLIAGLSVPVVKMATDFNEGHEHIYYKNGFNMFQRINTLIVENWSFSGDVMTNTSPGFEYCNQVMRRMVKSNTSSGTDPVYCSATPSSIPDNPNFITPNGMRWYGFNNGDFTSSGGGLPYIKVHVDIDGNGKGANTEDNDILPICVSDTGKAWPCDTNTKTMLLREQ